MNVNRISTSWRSSRDDAGDDAHPPSAASTSAEAAPPDAASGSTICLDGYVGERRVLYEKEGDDADALDMHDITQGHVGDCFLLAPLAGLASTAEGRAFIRHSITENHNPDGSVASYTVTLHRKVEATAGGASRAATFVETHVVVDASADFGCAHAQARWEGGVNEIWPLVYEVAYEQMVGGRDVVQRSGRPVPDGMEVITGRPPDAYGSKASPALMATIEQAVQAGRVVVLSTGWSIFSIQTGVPSGIINNHAYLVTGTERRNGELFLHLHNPHNKAATQPSVMSYAELERWASGVTICDVK